MKRQDLRLHGYDSSCFLDEELIELLHRGKVLLLFEEHTVKIY